MVDVDEMQGASTDDRLSTAAIYTGDKSTIYLNSKIKTKIQITSGIMQGHTGSTSFSSC